jgi:HD-GYP domain-containing protein (c-di-GMP phosphodiesterase class II)
MNIKKGIKYSFLVIIFLVITISILNNKTLDDINKNNFNRKYISNLVRIQNKMNEITSKTILIKNINELEKIKTDFTKEEINFESLKKDFLIISSDNMANKEFNTDLNIVFKNEKTIEKSFETIYEVQKEKIRLQNLFLEKYPLENKLRNSLQSLIWESNNINLIKDFSDLKYYSKEALYQYHNKKYLDKWLNKTLELKELNPKINFEQYLKVVKLLSLNVVQMNNILEKEKRALEATSNVIKQNQKLNNKTLDDSSTFLNEFLKYQHNLILIISIITILFIVILAYYIYKNVGMSVDEIESKVEESTKEIRSLSKEIETTQKEVVFTMGAIGESRSKETGNHVKRVAEYSKLLALYYGLSENEAEMLKQASPMHDIGKVAIPDSILNKPGRFDEEERKIMNTHAQLGYEMLKNSNRPLLKAAAIVAYEHHEKWDGSGYPNKTKGEDIHIYGRITALADVFDALGSDRVYKKAWSDEKIFNLFKEERAKHFDPKLIDIFFENLDEFKKVRDKFKDT